MLLRILSIICLFFCTVCFSNESSEIDDPLLSEILATQDESIVNVIDNKIYVNPDKIFPTPQGLFLKIDESKNQYIAIPTLHSDAQGCYVEQVFSRKVTSPCPHCGWERISWAIKCRNPNCPSNQPKPNK